MQSNLNVLNEKGKEIRRELRNHLYKYGEKSDDVNYFKFTRHLTDLTKILKIEKMLKTLSG